MNEERMIRVWRFEDAPQAFQDLSTNGGDEDWIALVPASYGRDHYIHWLDEGTAFGCCSVDEFSHA